MRRWWLLLLMPLPVFAAGNPPLAGKFTNGECLGCHAQRDATLVAAWRASSHARVAPRADCVACHGHSHAGANVHARRDDVCLACHDQLSHETVHSYATSKHAVIVKLQGDGWDWSRPLARGNYRAPGCAYCHLHAGEHDTRLLLTPSDPWHRAAAPSPDSIVEQRQSVCGDCHAPRYVTEQTRTGLRMIEIASMKLREARAVTTSSDNTLPDADRRALDAMRSGMQDHARNVRLGVGHQSPDYQWWHGQPALDGDLLRIKGLISDLERQCALRTAARTSTPHTRPDNSSTACP